MVDCHFSRRIAPLLSNNQEILISTSMQSPYRNSLQKIDERQIYSIQCKKKGHLQTEEYEQAWEDKYLNQAARQWCDNQLSHHTVVQRKRQEDMARDRESKFKILTKKFSKRKQRQFEKYRAYAVKMKIPAFAENQRGKAKNEKKLHGHRNAESKNQLSQIYDYVHPKLEELVKNHSKYLSANLYEEQKNPTLFNKRTIKSQNQKKLTLRKKSINPINNVEKKKNFEPNFVRSTNQYFKTSLSPRGLKKLKVSLEGERNSYIQKRYQPESDQTEYKNKSEIGCRLQKKQELPVQRAEWHENTKLSPVKQNRKVSPAKQYATNTSKYLEKGISFKRNRKKEEDEKEKPESGLAQRQGESLKSKDEYSQKNITEHSQSPQKLITRMVYTSKEMIRQKNRANSGKCDLQQSKEFKINKVFIFNSEDRYIRRLLVNSSWIVNPDERSKYYHMKWVFKPNSEDYNNIRQGQFINHIKNSHELTSKNYLNKNLKKSLSLWPKMNLHYPKCYDIAKGGERQQFFEQFVKEFMMNLLQKIYVYLEEYREKDVRKYTGLYEQLLDQKGDYKVQDKASSFLRRNQFRKIDLQDYKSYDSACLVHMNLIIVALRYWRHLRKRLELNADESGFHFLNYTQKELEEHLNYLEKYSKGVLPSFSPIDQPYFVKQFYATPSQITIQRVVKQYVYFQRLLGKQWKVYGSRNTWIIKPCSASRGNGIYLQNNCKQILFNSNGGIQSKIVQRYIEHPLIFKSPKCKQIVNKKFDIRQWVLLRSVAPLQIYMFSHCYVRICSEQYDISNIKNLRSHLTNYSFNKNFYKNRAESVLDHESFTDLLKQECCIDYESVLKPKITQIIIKSIKSSQQLLQDYSQRCFSLLGYDILLDEQCNPWLLEVNMSPACEERTQWLKQYLNEMGKGLLKIILPENYLDMESKIKAQSSLDNYQQKIITQINEDGQLLADMYQETEQNSPKKEIEGIQNAFSDGNQSANDEILITYADFVNQHNVQIPSPENKIEEESLRVKVPTECLQKQYVTTLVKDNLQISIVQDEQQPIGKHDQGREKEQICLQKRNKESENGSTFIYPSDFNDHIRDKGRSLKWELICLEQYSQPKKDKDLCLQIVGARITTDKMQESDKKINEWAKYTGHIQGSIVKVQKRIKTFLINRKLKEQIAKEESCRSLKVNFSRLIKKRVQRQSKSVRCATEQRSKSIWHYSYRHIYEGDSCRSVMIERPLTSRAVDDQKEVGRMKSSSDIKVGDTIKQFFSKGRFLYEENLNMKKTISNVAVKHERHLQTQMQQNKQLEIPENIDIQERKEIGRLSDGLTHLKTEGQ